MPFLRYPSSPVPWCLAVLSGGSQVLGLYEVGVLLPSCFPHQGRAPHHLSLQGDDDDGEKEKMYDFLR